MVSSSNPVSEGKSAHLQTLLSDQPSCVSVSGSLGPFPPSPLGSLSQASTVTTSAVLLTQGQSPALTQPSNKTAVSDLAKEPLGAEFIQGFGSESENVAVLRGPAPGSVFDDYSWMRQPELIFGKQESRQVPAGGATEVRGQPGTEREQVPGEAAKSDPSSIDSSQEEDSLERLSPDSPFELLTEMQEKGTCEEETLEPLLTLDEHRVDLEGPKKPFLFAGGAERSSLAEMTSRTKAEGTAAIGQKSDDLKTSSLSHNRADTLEEVHDGQSKTKRGDAFKPNIIEEDVKSSSMQVAFKSFEPSVSGPVNNFSNSNPWDLSVEPRDKGKPICDLEMNLAQHPSGRAMEPASTAGAAELSPGKVCTDLPPKPAPDKVQETSVRMTESIRTPAGVAEEHPIDLADTSSPFLAEISPRSRTDDSWYLEEETKIFTAPKSSQSREESAPSQGSLQTQAGGVLARVLPEALETMEVDSSGESDDTVIEDLKPGPVRGSAGQRDKNEKEVVSDSSGLEKLVLVPVINVTETLAPSEGQGVSVRQPPRAAEGKGKQPEVSPELAHTREEHGDQTKVTVGEMASSGSEMSPSPSPPASDQLPFDQQKPTVEEMDRRGPECSSESSAASSPVGHPDLPPAAPSATPCLMDTRALADRVDTEDLSMNEGSSPLQEMIRRSTVQREHILGEVKAVAPQAVQTHSVIVRSTPVLVKTPALIVKSTPGVTQPFKDPAGVTDPLKTPAGVTDPLKTPAGVTDPLKTPAGVTDPLKTPAGVTDPLKTPAGVTDPLKTPAGVTDPLKTPAGVTDPLKTPAGVTDPLKSPAGVTDPLKTPAGVTDPLKTPAGVTDPLKTPAGVTDPLKTPAGVTDPLKTPAGVTDPLKTPAGVTEPLKTPAGVTEPLKTPAGVTDPLKTPPGVTEPLKTPAGMTEPLKTPAGVTEPLKTPAGVTDPLKTPVGMTDPLKTPARVTDPLKTPAGVTDPLKTPARVTDPLKTPAGVTDPLKTPARVTDPLKTPAGVTEPLKTPARVTEPLKTPAGVTEPLKTPARVTEPLKTPAGVTEPLKTPARVTDPLKTPARVTEPLKTPAGVTDPLKTPAGVTDPLKTPVGVTDPLKTPAVVTDPLKTPAGVTVPLKTPAGVTDPLKTPVVVTDPLKTPAVVTDPLKTPAGVTDPLKTPAGVTDPLKTPAGVTEPLKTPAGVTEPLKTPAGVTEPLKTPAGVTEPLKTPAGVTDPLKTPAVMTDPLKTPAGVTEPLKTPAGVTEPLKAPAGVTEPLKTPARVTDPLKNPAGVTEPLKAPAGVTEPLKGSPSPAKIPGDTDGESFIPAAQASRVKEDEGKPSPQAELPKPQTGIEQQGAVKRPPPPPAHPNVGVPPSVSQEKSEQRPQAPSEPVDIAAGRVAGDGLRNTAGKSFLSANLLLLTCITLLK
ncbi:uncharacterized protein LOC144490838 [Mustelus asterias]